MKNKSKNSFHTLIKTAVLVVCMAVSNHEVIFAQITPFKVNSSGITSFGSGFMTINPNNRNIYVNPTSFNIISTDDGFEDSGLFINNYRLQIYNNGYTNSGYFANKLLMNSDGINMSAKVGIGTLTPQHALDVWGNIALNGSVIHSSDARLKTNVNNLGATSSQFGKLRPVTYYLKPVDLSKYYQLVPDTVTINNDDELYRYLGIGKVDGTRKRIGFIAQEVREIYPELVYEDEQGMLGVDYVSLIPVLVGNVQDQNETIQMLHATVQMQNETIQTLVKRLEALEKNTGSGTVQESADAGNFAFSLFPNPASGFVTVDYTMFVDASICIELYNTFGQRVKLITPQQNQKAGTYSVQVSVSDLGTGTFIVRATSGNYIESKQLVINN